MGKKCIEGLQGTSKKSWLKAFQATTHVCAYMHVCTMFAYSVVVVGANRHSQKRILNRDGHAKPEQIY